MNNPMNHLQTAVATALCVATLGLATVTPAQADGGASTRNIILGIGALGALGAVGSNVAHKKAAANTVQGYTPNGATVYNDGHVAMPNGQSYNPKDYGQTVACSNGNCSITGGSSNAPFSTADENGNRTADNGNR